VNLTYLDLSLNNLSIMLELEIFSKLINLQDLDFSYNNVSFNINNNITKILPMLQSLSLRSSNISEFPTFLRTTPNLLILDLSDNKICGQDPIWLGDVARDSLSFLNLSHSFLTSIDEIPWKNIISVDLHDNLLQGPFPALRAPSLEYLLISQKANDQDIAYNLYLLSLPYLIWEWLKACP
jgi:Leucine-rich repeat (LRR) protein